MQAGDEEVPFVGSDNLEKIYFDNSYFLFYHDRIKVNKIEKIKFVTWEYEFTQLNLNIKEYIYGYNLYKRRIGTGLSIDYGIIANVSYMYNYENCPNDGYYWVDSYDNEIISFIPPNPEREGYMFDGWYKEKECINKWDFNTDKTGEELIIEENSQYNEYPGIYLYAKWIKK